MDKLIMIREAAGPAKGTYKLATWHGPLNSKARHYIWRLMAEYFEHLYRVLPFADRIDLCANIFDGRGEMEPIYLTYGGIIAGDQWQMYAGGYWGVPRMARWTGGPGVELKNLS